MKNKVNRAFMAKKRILLNIALLCAAMTMSAQQAPEKLAVDPEVRYGKLDNGLTYYIRHNEQPKQRCEFHIAQAVGAILEEDHQNGLAHFLEHMAFNGTQHFPGKGIINYFESVGVSFGSNINAYTSIDETVYRLSDVPTYREGIIDSALLVMHDWSCGLLLLPEEIDAERGVIREEWRTGRTAQRRIWKELNAKMYPGTQYAKRDVIGDTAVINNFEYQALRDYYKKWYGPDNQAIIVVGDIDVDAIEAKIKELWKDVPRRANFGERPIYTVNHNDKPLVAIVTDPEAQQSRITMEYKFDQLPEALQGTAQEYVIKMVRDLACDMLNNRFSELALDPKASFAGAYAYYGETAKKMDAFTAIYVPKDGHETEAFNDLVFQLEKMHRYGFTSAELDRVKSEKLNAIEQYYKERDTRKNITLARECIRHFEDGESMPGAQWEYDMVQATLPLISLEAVNSMAQALIHPNPTVAISGPEKEGVNIPSEEAVLATLAAQADLVIEAPVEEKIDTELVKKAPRKGKIKAIKENEEFGFTEFTLSNGIKVVIRPTEFKADEILMQAFSKGGYTQVKTEDLPSAELASNLIQMSGIGRFNATQLEKALAGKTVSVRPEISECVERLHGSSSVKDLESMLSLTGFINRIQDMVVKQNIPVDALTLDMLRKEFPEMTDDQASKLEQYAVYQNSDKGDVKGVQLNVSANLFSGFNLSANYAYTYARTKSDAEWTPLERSVRHTATIAADYHHAWKRYRLNVNLNGRLQSKTYYPSYEDAPGYGIWNLYTTHSFDVAKWVLIEPSIGIDNLFDRVDRRIDSTTRKYALYSPGTMLVVGLKVKFK